MLKNMNKDCTPELIAAITERIIKLVMEEEKNQVVIPPSMF